MPLWKLLGGTREEIPCGVSIGIQATLAELVANVEQANSPPATSASRSRSSRARTSSRCARLRERFPQNPPDGGRQLRLPPGRCAAAEAARRLLPDHDRAAARLGRHLFSHVELQRQLETPICLDECIHTEEHARAAIELGACRIINIKLGRVGGYTPARRIHDLCQSKAIPVWCGGMLESGIGRAHNIAMSTLENFSLAGRRFRQPPLLGRRHHRARSGSHAARHDSRSRRPRNRLRAAPRPHRSAHRKKRNPQLAVRFSESRRRPRRLRKNSRQCQSWRRAEPVVGSSDLPSRLKIAEQRLFAALTKDNRVCLTESMFFRSLVNQTIFV